MRKLFIVSVFVSTIINKVNGQVQLADFNSAVNYLTGEWQWIEKCGGITGNECFNPASINQTRKYVFSSILGSADSLHYQYFENDTLKKEKNTAVSYTNTIIGNQWVLDGISKTWIYDSGSQTWFLDGFIEIIRPITPDTLLLSEDCADCYTSSYVKVNSAGIQYKNVKVEFTLYPNPTNSNIMVSGLKAGIYSFEFLDMQGQVFCSEIIEYTNETLILNPILSKGMYIIKIQNSNTVINRKIVFE